MINKNKNYEGEVDLRRAAESVVGNDSQVSADIFFLATSTFESASPSIVLPKANVSPW